MGPLCPLGPLSQWAMRPMVEEGPIESYDSKMRWVEASWPWRGILCASMPFPFLGCIAGVTFLHWKAVSFSQDLTEDGDEDRDGLVGDSGGSGTPVTSKLFWETRTPSKTSAVSPLLLSPGSSHHSQAYIENEAKVIQEVFLPHLCLNL